MPNGSVAQRLINGSNRVEDYDEVPTDIWFDGGIRDRPLMAEEAILLPNWDQCLSLIWLDDALNRCPERSHAGRDDEPLLQELDGTLPWPSKRRRK